MVTRQFSDCHLDCQYCNNHVKLLLTAYVVLCMHSDVYSIFIFKSNQFHFNHNALSVLHATLLWPCVIDVWPFAFAD